MGDMRSMTPGVAKQVAMKLTELQDTRTDAEMAEILGCSRPYWWQVKNGKRFISYEMVKRAGATFPDLVKIVVHDLSAPTEKAS